MGTSTQVRVASGEVTPVTEIEAEFQLYSVSREIRKLIRDFDEYDGSEFPSQCHAPNKQVA